MALFDFGALPVGSVVTTNADMSGVGAETYTATVSNKRTRYTDLKRHDGVTGGGPGGLWQVSNVVNHPQLVVKVESTQDGTPLFSRAHPSPKKKSLLSRVSFV